MGSANPPSQPINSIVTNQPDRPQHVPHNQVNPHQQPNCRMDNTNTIVQERNDRAIHNSDALIGVGGDVRNAFGSSNIGTRRNVFTLLIKFIN